MSATDEFARFRVTVFAVGCLLAVLAVSGVLNEILFTSPSTVKYVATVAASVLLVLLALTRAPLKMLVGLAIVVAPFDVGKTVADVHVTPLIAVDLLAVLAWLPRSDVRPKAALFPMTWIFILLLLPALAGSDGVVTWALWLTATVLTGYLAFVVAREPGGVLFVVSAIALSGIVQAALALWEFKTGHQLDLYQGTGSASYVQYFFKYGDFNRPAGALPDPIGLGQVLALCIPLMVALAVSLRRWQPAIIVLGGTAMAAVALLLSFSRMSMVGALFGVLVTALLLPRRALARRGAAVGAMVAFAVVLAFSLGGHTLGRRIDSIFHPTAAHVSTAAGDLTRQRIWRAAFKTGEAHLLTGVGIGRIQDYLPKYGVPVNPASHAHDTYLQFFAEGGVLALLGLLGVLGAAVVDLFRGFASNRVWVAGAAGGLVATMIAWITDVEVHYVQVSAMVAVLLGLIAALAVRQRRVSEQLVPAFDIGRGGAVGLAELTLNMAHGPVRRALTAPVAAEPAVVSPPPTAAARSSSARAPEPPAPPPPPAPPAPALATSDEAVRESRFEPESPATLEVSRAAPRVAIVFPSKEDGGAEQYVRVIARGAIDRGWSVHAGFPPLDATSALREQLQSIGVSCHALAIAGDDPHSAGDALRLMVSETWVTRKLLREVNPDAVLVVLPHPDQAPGMVLAAALRSARAVASVQLVPPDLHFTVGRRLFYRATRTLGERWLALAEYSQHGLARALGWRSGRIDLIFNGVQDEPSPRPDDRAAVRREVRDELGLPHGVSLILSVGRLNRQKGYDLIVNSIRDVAVDHADAYWVWAGDGPERESLSRRLEGLGIQDRVKMLGRREDVPRLLAASDLFAFPTRYEGAHPFALQEALLAEVPVIVSDAGPVPEIVRDGVEGRVVPSDNWVALAGMTSWALDHPSEMSSMGAAGRRRVLAEFSRQTMVDRTLELLSPGQKRRDDAS